MPKLLLLIGLLVQIGVAATPQNTFTSKNAELTDDFCTISAPASLDMGVFQVFELKEAESFIFADSGSKRFYKTTFKLEAEIQCTSGTTFELQADTMTGDFTGTNGYSFIVTLPNTQTVLGNSASSVTISDTGTGSPVLFELDIWVAHDTDFSNGSGNTVATVPLVLTTSPTG